MISSFRMGHMGNNAFQRSIYILANYITWPRHTTHISAYDGVVVLMLLLIYTRITFSHYSYIFFIYLLHFYNMFFSKNSEQVPEQQKNIGTKTIVLFMYQIQYTTCDGNMYTISSVIPNAVGYNYEQYTCNRAQIVSQIKNLRVMQKHISIS